MPNCKGIIRSKFTLNLPCYIAIIISCFFVTPSNANELSLSLTHDKGYLSKHLVGIHFVYNDEADAIYSNDDIAKWAKKAGVSTGRFPGGNTIKYWDWQNPTGYQEEDPWDPNVPEPIDPANWMSLDEYLHFVDVSGIKPLIGINIFSGHRFGRERESIKRAVNQVKYIVSKGYRGCYYYLGNEDFGPAFFGNRDNAAKAFVMHAKEIKKIDPEAILFWNDNHITPKRLENFLRIAGIYADGVEFHTKWPFGGKRRNYSVDVNYWQNQYPIQTDPHGSFSKRAELLRATAVSMGYPKFKVANNEYGLAQFVRDPFIDYNRYIYSLVAIEILQDLFIGRFETSSFWSNVPANRKGGTDREQKRLIDTKNGNRMNPIHYGFELISVAQGMKLIQIEGGSISAYGFGAINEKELHIFLLNKTGKPNSLILNIHEPEKINHISSAKSLVDTKDHWGTIIDIPAFFKEKQINATLPPLSFTRITISLAEKSE
ncbi:hypothetical protein [Desulfosediminicola flagellatus]|uniref:hypothetical protein n=1 Tax=Desulfosediminicola flagellatus TaxID=2569541 RepID=UPI0010AD9509|nr:hypothetical protein [Desulfosediminicola flagellatus]